MKSFQRYWSTKPAKQWKQGYQSMTLWITKSSRSKISLWCVTSKPVCLESWAKNKKLNHLGSLNCHQNGLAWQLKFDTQKSTVFLRTQSFLQNSHFSEMSPCLFDVVHLISYDLLLMPGLWCKVMWDDVLEDQMSTFHRQKRNPIISAEEKPQGLP